MKSFAALITLAASAAAISVSNMAQADSQHYGMGMPGMSFGGLGYTFDNNSVVDTVNQASNNDFGGDEYGEVVEDLEEDPTLIEDTINYNAPMFGGLAYKF